VGAEWAAGTSSSLGEKSAALPLCAGGSLDEAAAWTMEDNSATWAERLMRVDSVLAIREERAR